MGRSLVGLVAHRGVLTGGDPRMGHHVTAEAYSRAVARAGGLPVALPLVESGDVVDLLGRVDALIVTGGADVDPSTYGRERDERCGPSDPVRDATDIAFVRAAAEIGLPTLCICRGVQVLNVAFGGTLVQHLDDHMVVERYNATTHHVRVEPGSALSGLVGGAASIGVNSLHHQAIDDVGDGLRVTAWALDGTVEAVELVDAPQVRGVQWHPEMLRHRPEHLALFEALLAG
jgi:putative glutamine amidotransferase